MVDIFQLKIVVVLQPVTLELQQQNMATMETMMNGSVDYNIVNDHDMSHGSLIHDDDDERSGNDDDDRDYVAMHHDYRMAEYNLGMALTILILRFGIATLQTLDPEMLC